MKKTVIYFLKSLAICLQCAIVLVWIQVSVFLLPGDIDSNTGIVNTEENGEKTPLIVPQDNWKPNVDEPEG